jgi:hypothetical protein
VRGQKKVKIANPDMASKLRKKVRSIKVPAKPYPSSLPEDRFTKDVCFGCIDGCIRNRYKAKDGRAGKFMCQSALFYEVRARDFMERSQRFLFMQTNSVMILAWTHVLLKL